MLSPGGASQLQVTALLLLLLTSLSSLVMSVQIPLETDEDFFALCPDYVHYSTKTQYG